VLPVKIIFQYSEREDGNTLPEDLTQEITFNLVIHLVMQRIHHLPIMKKE